MNSEEELQELEKKLYAAADKMRGAVPVSSYKFIILGLIFLKYIKSVRFVLLTLFIYLIVLSYLVRENFYEK